MSNGNRDLAAIWDMVQAIREIQQFTEGFSEARYFETLWLQRVVERNLKLWRGFCLIYLKMARIFDLIRQPVISEQCQTYTKII